MRIAPSLRLEELDAAGGRSLLIRVEVLVAAALAAAGTTRLAIDHTMVSPVIWPAAGICVAYVVRGGLSRIPDAAAVALISAAVLTTNVPILFARAGFDVAAAALSWFVLARTGTLPLSIGRIRGALAFVFGAGAAATLAGAAFGVVQAWILPASFTEAPLHWSLAGVAGLYAFAPALLLAGEPWNVPRGGRALELAALLLATVGLGAKVFASDVTALGRLPFFPLLAWCVLRFRHQGTALFLAAAGTVYLLPWISLSGVLSKVLILVGLGLAAVIVGAIDSEREDAVERARELFEHERVARLDADSARDYVRGILEMITEPFVVVDKELHVVYANRAATSARLVGWRETAHGLLSELHVDPSPSPVGEERVDWTSPIDRRNYDVGVSRSGELLSLHFRDVTPEREAFERLATSERRYRELTEASFDLIAECDDSLRLVEINRRGEELTGRPAGELLGSSLLDLLTPDSAEMLASALTELEREPGSVVRREVDLVQSVDTPLRLDLTARFTYDESRGRRIQAVARDITERVRVTQRLREAQRLEAVGRLAGGVAHDFNNLLLVVSGYAELLSSSLAGTQAADDVGEIARTAEQGRALVRRLLAFARRQVLRVELVDLNNVVRETESMLLPLIGEDVELRTSFTSDPALVRADPGQLEQVLLNLALNSRDAMPDGGVVWISVEERQLERVPDWGDCEPAKYVALRVSDTGVGIAAELRDQIFEPFFTTKRDETNSGLGLSTGYGIVAQLGAGIDLESETGAGAAFTIYLPSATESDVELDELPSPPEVGESGEAEELLGTVLIVEDEDGPRRLLARVLEEQGHRVLCSSSPREALELMQSARGTIDVLVTDFVMPEMSGAELVRRFQQIQPLTPVIYMTGYSDRAVELRGKLGGVALLEKPFKAAEIGRVVREALSRANRKEARQS
ncbi:MAG TPA: ATP-binding protein [Gaiellaceae bacterium]|nr:ATP-binding protein [Gaiellaceae bacterium]